MRVTEQTYPDTGTEANERDGVAANIEGTATSKTSLIKTRVIHEPA